MLVVQLTRILRTREEARSFAVQFARHFSAIYVYEHPKSKPRFRLYSVVVPFDDVPRSDSHQPMKVTDKRLERITTP